ncbi:probable G-protein coupled receptor 141 [Colossoma macropomum]|uniref:probable G-protein coupled receptor 141 n=1 Tax=Colossoma macropomum TaxID=42526 RepID=UPI001864303B|nr:probable G-protein coupled receptor 141 [Colossoma macropomum]XP_036452484.1 probable G-protein coupled receptor 141 [Colossoma macropomum]
MAEASNVTTQPPMLPLEYRVSLVFLYTLIFLGGSIGAGLMSTILKSNMLSITTVSVINLLVVHLLFLLTVPFRIYYYVSDHWALGRDFCKMVSGMIHAHMYLSFIFYIVILAARYLAYFEWGHQLEFYRALHAVIASVSLWAIILGSALPASLVTYGSVPNGSLSNEVCFDFGGALQNVGVEILNYIISAVVLLAWIVLACIQLCILWRVYGKYGRASFAHQEFWAQIKSLFFVLIMFLCFVPYNVFRIYYVSKYWAGLQKVNEVFLAITAFSCFDMLTFAGRGVWRSAYTQCCTLCERRR